MEFLGKNKFTAEVPADGALYRALACGDLPAAYLLGKGIQETENYATAFNCGLCFYLLDEWEKALTELNFAERLLGNVPEYGISDRTLFLKALEGSGGGQAVAPLDPDAPAECGRYALIRVRWLIALCLMKLGRENEAAPVVRFLSQYNIQVQL